MDCGNWFCAVPQTKSTVLKEWEKLKPMANDKMTNLNKISKTYKCYWMTCIKASLSFSWVFQFLCHVCNMCVHFFQFCIIHLGKLWLQHTAMTQRHLVRNWNICHIKMQRSQPVSKFIHSHFRHTLTAAGRQRSCHWSAQNALCCPGISLLENVPEVLMNKLGNWLIKMQHKKQCFTVRSTRNQQINIIYANNVNKLPD